MEWSWTPFDKHECIFIHVPKTAGMAVCECLFGSLVGHHRASEFKGFPRHYFMFAFVRNPFDRLISAYEWYHHPDRNENDRAFREMMMDPYPSFADWVVHGLDKCLEGEHFRPQSYWLDEPMDFIGKYEHLREGVRYVQNITGMFVRPLNVVNKSIRTGGYWNAEAHEKVRKVYAEDFYRFRY